MSKTFDRIQQLKKYSCPDNWHKIKTIDLHTCGEPLRVIMAGYPTLQGKNVLEYRNLIKEKYDYLRTTLMLEPRGHADMYGCLLTPPNNDDGDFGIIFMHNEGYSTMCGHAIIAISTLAVQMQWLEITEGDNVLKIDAPCGRITSFVNVKDGKVKGVRFHCVPSFVLGLDLNITILGLGTITYDLAYGGAFYAYVDLDKNNLGIELNTKHYNKVIEIGMLIKNTIIQSDQRIEHPLEKDLSFLYGTIFIGKSNQSNIHSRNVCVFAEGEVDRCPTGSGVSGRMAIHHARKEIAIGDIMSIESIIGTTFFGSIVENITYGPYNAVIPEVSGTAHITAESTFIVDPNDPLKEGFLLR